MEGDKQIYCIKTGPGNFRDVQDSPEEYNKRAIIAPNNKTLKNCIQ